MQEGTGAFVSPRSDLLSPNSKNGSAIQLIPNESNTGNNNKAQEVAPIANNNWKEIGWKRAVQGGIWIIADGMSIVELAMTLSMGDNFSKMSAMDKAQTVIGSFILNSAILIGDGARILASSSDTGLLLLSEVTSGIAAVAMITSLTMSMYSSIDATLSFSGTLKKWAIVEDVAIGITGLLAPILMVAGGPVGLGIGVALSLFLPNFLEWGFSNYYEQYKNICNNNGLNGDALIYSELATLAKWQIEPITGMFAAVIKSNIAASFSKAINYDYDSYCQTVAVQRVQAILCLVAAGVIQNMGNTWSKTGDILSKNIDNSDDILKILETTRDDLNTTTTTLTNTIEQSLLMANQVFIFSQMETIVDASQISSSYGQKTANVYDALVASKINSGRMLQAFEANTYDQDGANNLFKTVDASTLIGLPQNAVVSGVTLSGRDIYSANGTSLVLSGIDLSNVALSGISQNGILLSATIVSDITVSGIDLKGDTLDGGFVVNNIMTINNNASTFDEMYVLNDSNINYTFSEKAWQSDFFLVNSLLQSLTLQTYSTTGTIIQLDMSLVNSNSQILSKTTQLYSLNGQALNTGYTTLQFESSPQTTPENDSIDLGKLTNHSIHSLVAPVTAGFNNNFYSGSDATEKNILSGAGNNFYAGLGKDVERGTGPSSGQSAPVTGTVPIATNLYSNLASKNGIQFIVAGRDVNVFGNATIEGASAAYNMSAADTVSFDSSSALSISQLFDLSVTDGEFGSVTNNDGNTTAYFDGSKGFWNPANDPTDVSSLQSVPNYIFAPGATSGVIRVDTMTVHGSNENIIAMSDSTGSYGGTLIVNIKGEIAPAGSTNAGTVIGGTGNNIQGGNGNLLEESDTAGNWAATGDAAYNFIGEEPGTRNTSSDGSSIDLNPTNTNSWTNGGAVGSHKQYTVIDNFGSYDPNTTYFNPGTKSSFIAGLGGSNLIFNGQAQNIAGIIFNKAIYTDIYETDATQQSGAVFFNFVADDNAVSMTQTSNDASKPGNVLTLTANKDNVTGMLDSITMTLGNGATTGTTKDDLRAETTNDTITAVLHLLNQTAMTNLATYDSSTNTYGVNSNHTLSFAGGVVADNGGTLSTYFSQNASLDPNDLTHGIVDNTKSVGSWQDIHIQFWNQDTNGNLTAAQSYNINVADIVANGTIKV